MFLEILFQKVQQFLEIFLAAFEKDERTVLWKVLFNHIFKVCSFFSEVDMERDFKLLLTGVAVDESPNTALKDLLVVVFSNIVQVYFLFEDR